MRDVFLIEDHDEALKIWMKKDIKGLDLVHVDAHMDFDFHPAKEIEKAFGEAKTLKELKRDLEQSIAFAHYERSFDKQTNVGNYIYPAVERGIVRDFYWVIPGRLDRAEGSKKIAKSALRAIMRRQGDKRIILNEDEDGVISGRCLGRNFFVCDLDNLPVLAGDAILDIDVDFLLIDAIKDADSTKRIGRRRPWIRPKDMVDILRRKVLNPKITTISYSVNGGWTPMAYKHLGDELAYLFNAPKFKRRFETNSEAAEYLNLFYSTGRRGYYRKAAALNPTYRLIDNSFGQLYLSLRKFSFAQKEFGKALRADRQNPAPLFGLGVVAVEKRDLKRAKRYLESALSLAKNQRLFSSTKKQILFELGRAEFYSGNFKKAKRLLSSYKKIFPLEPQSYWFLGRIFEKERNFAKAVAFYKDAMRLGFDGIEILFRVLSSASHLGDRDAVVKFVISKFRAYKKNYKALKKSKRPERAALLDKRLSALEKRLEAHT